jgi:glycosyltransferase involved in cell wall biosynthesis
VERPIDLAVVAQDPWFGGGARAHLEAFCAAAAGLGRKPAALYLQRGVDGGGVCGGEVAPYRSILPQLDAVNQLLAARMARRVRRARSAWVVASAAHYGLAAAQSGRRYACWLGTSARDERNGRLAGGLRGSRRLALRVNAPVLERVERRVLRHAVALYATSSASREAVAAAAGVAPESVGILPLPVDLERFRPEPDEAWLARLDAPAIAFAGRANDPRKNVGLLLDAFSQLRERMPAARLRLVGAPPTGPIPEGVDVLGEVASVADALRTSTLFALPSHQEGFGIVVAEALACGVPAVVTPSGGPEELVRSSGGGVVLGTFEEEELAATLTTLLGDRERLLEARRAGRAYVEREHAPERLSEGLARAFEELDA